MCQGCFDVKCLRRSDVTDVVPDAPDAHVPDALDGSRLVSSIHQIHQMKVICGAGALVIHFKIEKVGKRANFHKIPCFTSPRHASFNSMN